MIDYATDEDGNYYTDENGDMALLTGHEEVIAAVRTLLRTFLGEWWLDPNFGIDYLRVFLVRDFSPAQGNSEIRRKVRAIEGVLRVYDVSCSVSADQTEVTINLTVVSVYSSTPETITETVTI